MDLEIDFIYRNLTIHHLKCSEIEYELKIRDLSISKSETRAVLKKQFSKQARTEEVRYPGLDRYMRRNTVDEEIWRVDENVCEIKRSLNVEHDGGARERLRTRLVHYLARVYRIADYTEDEEDLADIDMLAEVIRNTMNLHFSYWSALRLGSITQFNQPPIIPRISFPFSFPPVAQKVSPYQMHPYVPAYPPMPGWHSQGMNLPWNSPSSNASNPRLDPHKPRTENHSRKSEHNSNASRSKSDCSSNRNSKSESGVNSSGTESGSGKSRNSKRRSRKKSSPVESRRQTNIREPEITSNVSSRDDPGWLSNNSRKESVRKKKVESEWPRPFKDWWSKFDGTGNAYQNELFRSITKPFATSALPWSTIGGGMEVLHGGSTKQSNFQPQTTANPRKT